MKYIKVVCINDLIYQDVLYFKKGQKFFTEIIKTPFQANVITSLTTSVMFNDTANGYIGEGSTLFYQTFTTEKEILNKKLKKIKFI